MKARQNSDDSTRAYERDAKMAPIEKPVNWRDNLLIVGEVAMLLLALLSILGIVLTIMHG